MPLAQQWEDLEIKDVPSCTRAAILGRRPGTVSHLIVWTIELLVRDYIQDGIIPVIPCAMADSLSLGWYAIYSPIRHVLNASLIGLGALSRI